MIIVIASALWIFIICFIYMEALLGYMRHKIFGAVVDYIILATFLLFGFIVYWYNMSNLMP